MFYPLAPMVLLSIKAGTAFPAPKKVVCEMFPNRPAPHVPVASLKTANASTFAQTFPSAMKKATVFLAKPPKLFRLTPCFWNVKNVPKEWL